MRVSITTAALLLLAASTVSSAEEDLLITHGTATYDGYSVQFNVGGNGGWTMGGSAGTGAPTILENPQGTFELWQGMYTGLDAFVSYNGWPGEYNGDPSSAVGFAGLVTVTHPGTYTEPFGGEIDFTCFPCFGNGIDSVNIIATGGGTFTSTWAESPDGTFYLAAPATYNFGVPEPGTLGLCLLGAVGFVVSARRKRGTRATYALLEVREESCRGGGGCEA